METLDASVRFPRVILTVSCVALLAWAASGCSPLVTIAPTSVRVTVTPVPNAPSSPTPFQPPAGTPAVSPTSSALPSQISSPPPSSTPESTPLPPSVEAAPLYTLSAVLDYTARTLQVDEAISYPNASGETLHQLVLAVEANRWEHCFGLASLAVNDQAVSGYGLNGITLEVPLPAAFAPGESLTLFLHYELHLPQADVTRVFGYNDWQANLVDWYPYVVPYSIHNGWLLHPPGEVGEHLVYDTADFDVTLRLTNPGMPVTIAASAPAEPVTGGWHYHLEHARAFAFSASMAYQSSSVTVGSATVTSYYFAGEETAGVAVLQQVAKALGTYDGLFGSYTHPSLSIVEAVFNDGLESDGLFFLGRDFYNAYDGTLLNYLIDIGVHETAHQWWFGLVGDDQALEPWLDEALATYSEHLFYEANYPGVTAWWSFRVEAYAPTGWVDTDIYHAGGFRPYANAVYLRGAQFLEAVRGRVGEAAFFAFLKDYASQMSGEIATAEDFFRILRQHTSADLSDIVKFYFQNQY